MKSNAGEANTAGSLAEPSARARAERPRAAQPASGAQAIGYPQAMESPPERVCPSCSAPAQSQQRWCLECGAELSQSRRRGLGPAISIATTIAVLVGAASAGGYTLLQEGKQAPPPATTVAQEIPAPTPPTVPTTPETVEPDPLPPSEPLPFDPVEPEPLPDEVELDTYSPPPPPPPADTGGGGDTADEDPADTSAGRQQGERDRDKRPKLRLSDVALGAAAVVYAPYTPADVDLGDPSFVSDGDPKTAWTTPSYEDPATHPQLGVYIDLGAQERLRRLVLQTPTPGMSVEIYGARKGPPNSITDPGWDHLVNRANVPEKTTFKLGDRSYRFLLVWVTGLPEGGDHAAISELSLFSMQPE